MVDERFVEFGLELSDGAAAGFEAADGTGAAAGVQKWQDRGFSPQVRERPRSVIAGPVARKVLAAHDRAGLRNTFGPTGRLEVYGAQRADAICDTAG